MHVLLCDSQLPPLQSVLYLVQCTMYMTLYGCALNEELDTCTYVSLVAIYYKIFAYIINLLIYTTMYRNCVHVRQRTVLCFKFGCCSWAARLARIGSAACTMRGAAPTWLVLRTAASNQVVVSRRHGVVPLAVF